MDLVEEAGAQSSVFALALQAILMYNGEEDGGMDGMSTKIDVVDNELRQQSGIAAFTKDSYIVL